ncbi:SDR family oxidoreductase [Variovorax sp. JS1663]|uniref:SDR family oxidoreductase n=1 Tax=Variovorax sp. JS1663 TaxID=1851577 RepID=UPI000B346A12|nr:SDR family oxidoreductase [Variovorax sp. JS1663]OUL99740.1 short-chain dehydrogenase [Variovorax sp. JS1663]
MFKDNLFAGQRVLVTGGGTGLGFEMAKQLAALGAEIHLCGRRAGVLDEAAEQLRGGFGATVGTHALDIRSPQAVDEMMERIWTQHGPLDALVNNAAGNFISRTEDLSPNGFHAISDIVFRGTFYATQAAGKRWIAGGRGGSVLSIVVTWVTTGSPFVVPSAMSKAGIDVMTKSLAVEWGPKGIRLNAIAPGVIPTAGATGRLRPGEDNQQDQRGRENPTRRLGTGEDLGRLAAFLLARESSWINGQTITLDGGDALANGAYFTQYQDWGDADWQAARERIQALNAADKAQRGAE